MPDDSVQGEKQFLRQVQMFGLNPEEYDRLKSAEKSKKKEEIVSK